MSNEERHHEDPSRPTTPIPQEIRTLLVRLLELLAARIAEKLQPRSPAKPGRPRPTDHS